MYKQCQTEQSAARQRQLEEGLLEAMKYKMYEDISVSDLCREMNIPRKAFYRYFSGKEGALFALLDHILQDYELYVTPKLTENSSHMDYMELIFSYWLSRREVLDVLHHSALSGVLIQRAILRAQEETSHPIRFLPVEVLSDQKHVTLFLVSGLMSMVLQWHSGGYVESEKEMARIAMRLLTQPLVPME